MIIYIAKSDYCVGCRGRAAKHMEPRANDFEYVYFKVNDVWYFEWNKEFEQALLVEKLTRDPI